MKSFDVWARDLAKDISDATGVGAGFTERCHEAAERAYLGNDKPAKASEYIEISDDPAVKRQLDALNEYRNWRDRGRPTCMDLNADMFKVILITE